MAKVVKLKKGAEFVFSKPPSGGGESKYAWDEWFNGELNLIEQSTGTKDDKGTVTEIEDKLDFEVDVNTMPAKLKTAARRRYKVVQISRYDPDRNRLENALIIKARDMTEEERQAEDLLRAEEKAEKESKKEQKKAATNGAQPSPLAATA